MNWAETTLGQVADINPRSRDWTTLAPETPVSFVPMSAISQRTASITEMVVRPLADVRKGFTPFRDNDVLFAKITPCMENGKAALATNLQNGIGFGSTEFHVLRARGGNLPQFIYYFVRQSEFRMAAKQRFRGAAGQQRVPEDFLTSYAFPNVAPTEQRRIVEILEQTDALRQKRAEADALADRILPALFHKLFGDPATNPKGWPRVRLGTIIADTRNGLYKHADFYGRGTQILKMFNILEGRLNLSRVDRVELDQQELAAYRLEAGDILVNRVNTPELVGKCAVISAELGEAVFESKNIRLRLNTNVAEPTYVAHFLSTSFGHATLCQGLKHAIGMATINNSDVRNCLLPLPPIKNQLEWAKHVASVRATTSKTEAASTNLEHLFRALLHRAYTGELTAKWREAHLKELLAEMEQQARLLRSSPNGRN